MSKLAYISRVYGAFLAKVVHTKMKFLEFVPKIAKFAIFRIRIRTVVRGNTLPTEFRFMSFFEKKLCAFL